MRLHDPFQGLQSALGVRILGGDSGDVIGLLICFLGVVDLEARHEAQLTPDYLSRGRSSELVRVRPIEKSHCSLASLAVTNRKNRMTRLGWGTDLEC